MDSRRDRPDARITAGQQARPPPERTTSMSELTELAEKYIAMWNETDPSARRALISEGWSDDGRYVDPLAAVTGHDEIDALVAGAQAPSPGMPSRLPSAGDPPPAHARSTWGLAPAAAAAPA